MNLLDILAGILLVWCLWSGWRRGILVQLGGIVGIVVGAWVAYRFSHMVGRWLDLEELPAEALFVVVLVAVMVCVILLSHLITKLLKAGGLAGPLRVLGALFAAAKGILLLGLAVAAIEAVLPWCSPKNRASVGKMLTEARSYPLLKKVGTFVFPYIVSGAKAAAAEWHQPTTEPTGVPSGGDTTVSAPVGDSAISIMP